MSDWFETSLENLAISVARGVSPKYSEIDGIPVINQKCIRNGKIDLTLARIHDTNKKFSAEKLLKKGDILINSTGVGTAGRVAIFDELRDTICDSHVSILRLNTDKYFPKFVFYNLRGREKEIEETAEGSTGQIELSRDGIRSLELMVPNDKEEQKAIAEVLSSLDDKIDLLHRQNKTLESLAETLFRQYFIGTAQDDWEITTVGEVITIKGGTTPSTKSPEFWDGDVYWTSPRDLSSHKSVFMFDTERKITKLGLSKIGSGLMPIGTVLMSSRAPIGYLAIADIPVAINQGYIAIVCDKSISNIFMYLWCKANMEDIKNAGNGSTFEEISKSNFKALEFVLPPNELLNFFEEQAKSLFAKIHSNATQIQKLEKLRDNLLPKLMNGDVRVEIKEQI